MFNEIDIENLRVFRQASMRPREGLNCVTGPNGAGKTTVLEAAYMAAVGKSFRNRETGPLVREGENHLQVVAKFQDSALVGHTVGMLRERGSVTVKFDGRTSVRRSEILRLIPIQFIGSDPQQLVNGPPENRRSFLDGGLFHVEPGYLALLQDYSRALHQRNANLKQGSSAFSAWDQQLIALGTELHDYRSGYFSRLVPFVEDLLASWSLGFSAEFVFHSGWSRSVPLKEALASARDNDRKRMYTTVGPHRADLTLSSRNLKSGKVLSRGQMKMLVVAMTLGQANLNRELGSEYRVLLFDDLGAELDVKNRKRVLEALEKHYPQIITTLLEPMELGDVEASAMFHVEQGLIRNV